MKGLVLRDVEVVEFVSDLTDPAVEDAGDVVVEVERAGICGSDLHQYHGRERVSPQTIPGHEFVGRVVETGSAVRNFAIGDRVFSPFTTSCGDCFFCHNGLSARCQRWQIFGYRPPADVEDTGQGIQGAQAELVRVPLADTTLLRVSADLSAEAALLLGDNFTTGFFCADMGSIVRDGITLVIGCGSVGLSAIVAARYLGAEQVVAIDLVSERRARATQLGARAISPEESQDVIAELAAPTGRQGADSVLEAVGSPAAQRLAFSLIRPGGTIAAVGVHTAEQFAFSPAEAYDHNVIYKAGRCSIRSYLDRVMPAVQDGSLQIPVDQIVTEAAAPMSQGVSSYRQFANREADCVKILLDPKC